MALKNCKILKLLSYGSQDQRRSFADPNSLKNYGSEIELSEVLTILIKDNLMESKKCCQLIVAYIFQ